MSHLNAAPVETLCLYRLESFGKSSDGENRHDLRPPVCLFLSSAAFFSSTPSFVLYSGEIVGVTDL